MIVLASKSPRRRELFARLGVEYEIRTVETAEYFDPVLPPELAVQQVSRGKAAAVRASAGPEDLIVSADTIVVLDDRILGKPKDPQAAAEMLRSLSGRTHRVMTGLTLLRGGDCRQHTEITEVTFRTLSEAEIDAYVATGDPMDKAGAYGIQSGAGLFVTGIRGDYFNVMGLPLCALTLLLRQLGVTILGEGGTCP